MRRLMLCPVAVLLLAGCGQDSAPTDPGLEFLTEDSACHSGVGWTGEDFGSALMHPGSDCMTCHEAMGAPELEIAGTVFEALTEPDDCAGIEGVTVTVTDFDDQVIELVSNAAGNFHLLKAEAPAIAYPVTIKISLGDRTDEMGSPAGYGSCNDCHSQEGDWAANGRVLLLP